jgi:hypothetical protein
MISSSAGKNLNPGGSSSCPPATWSSAWFITDTSDISSDDDGPSTSLFFFSCFNTKVRNKQLKWLPQLIDKETRERERGVCEREGWVQKQEKGAWNGGAEGRGARFIGLSTVAGADWRRGKRRAEAACRRRYLFFSLEKNSVYQM